MQQILTELKVFEIIFTISYMFTSMWFFSLACGQTLLSWTWKVSEAAWHKDFSKNIPADRKSWEVCEDMIVNNIRTPNNSSLNVNYREFFMVWLQLSDLTGFKYSKTFPFTLTVTTWGPGAWQRLLTEYISQNPLGVWQFHMRRWKESFQSRPVQPTTDL